MEDQTLVDERVENEKIFNTIANQYIKQNLNGDISSLNMVMKELEKIIITKALFVFNGNQRKVATLLRIKHTTLNEKIKRWDIGFKKQTVFENFLN